MALYPEAQKKAQAELDAIVGPERLPDLSDRDALQYVNAVVKETLRWYTAVPLGVPHCTTEEDEYNGYYIPKDATVLINSWSECYSQGPYASADRECTGRSPTTRTFIQSLNGSYQIGISKTGNLTRT